MIAAVNDLQLGGTADLAREANTSRTHNAAVGEQGDLVADVGLVGRLVLVVDHSALRPAEAETVILQQALAGLVAHGTIEWMIEEQRLEGLHLSVPGLVAVGDDNRAILGGRLAGGHHLRLHGHGAVRLALAHLDQAHPATGDDCQGGMPAIIRNGHAATHGRLNQVQLVAADVDRVIIDVNDGH